MEIIFINSVITWCLCNIYIVKFLATNTYYGGAWLLSFFYNPYDVKQIEDKKYTIKEKNNYLIIETIF